MSEDTPTTAPGRDARGAQQGPRCVDPADRAEAVEVLARYAELMDAGDFAGVGRLLSEATIEDAEGRQVAAGAEAVAELYRRTTRLHADGTPCTAHVVTNAIVEGTPGDDDEIEVRSRFTVLQGTATLPLQPIVAGRYVDRMRRIDGTWRIVVRRMVPERWGRVDEHLTFDPT